MRHPTNRQEPGKPGNAEQQLRKSLEQEQDTARRQELLKALWKLAQQSETSYFDGSGEQRIRSARYAAKAPGDDVARY